MNNIILSASPAECARILNGEQTALIRRVAPRELPVTVWLYCKKREWLERTEQGIYQLRSRKGGKNNIPVNPIDGYVVAKFVLREVEIYPRFYVSEYQDIDYKRMCMTFREFDEYVSASTEICIYPITDLEIIEPRELGSFWQACAEIEKNNPNCERCRYGHTEYCGMDCPPYFECRCEGVKPLTRPPATFAYVEVGND